MVQRVMTTGGYPTKLPDADEISQDVSGDLMKREISVSQLTGISSAVKAVLNAQSDAEIRQQVGIVDSGIAVKGDTGSQHTSLLSSRALPALLMNGSNRCMAMMAKTDLTVRMVPMVKTVAMVQMVQTVNQPMR